MPGDDVRTQVPMHAVAYVTMDLGRTAVPNAFQMPALNMEETYSLHVKNLLKPLESWEKFGGSAKYILTVIKV